MVQISVDDSSLPLLLRNDVQINPSSAQCDACSPTIVAKVPIWHSDSEHTLYKTPPNLIECSIPSTPYHFVHSSNVCASVVLNGSALAHLHYFNKPRFLDSYPTTWNETWGKDRVRSIEKEMLELGLLVPSIYAPPTRIETPTILAAWLHITDRCNLRCAYCYSPHVPTDMSAETGKTAIEGVLQAALCHGYPRVKLKYAGGEPLLHFSLLTELHDFAQELADRRSILLDGVILSNGTLLTSEMLSAMRSLGLRLTISLDSLDESHVDQRPFANGQNSIPSAMKGIELALEAGLVPDISITITGQSITGLPKLLGWILERDLPFSRNFYRENDLSASNRNLILEEKQLILGLLAAYKVIEANLPNRSLMSSLADRANLAFPHIRPCSAGHSYLAVDPSGQVSKCQMDMKQPVTTIHDPDLLTAVRKNPDGIHNLPVDEKVECRNCQWRYWCGSGCPLETHRVTGRYDGRSPHCKVYKKLFPEILRLEGLRMLKYQHQMDMEQATVPVDSDSQHLET